MESDDLFLGQRNNGVQSKTIQRAVQRFAKQAGLKNITPHTLRHTFAKNLIDSNVTLDKVAMLLGHSSLNTTRIYTALGEEDLEEAIRKLNNNASSSPIL